MLQDKTATLLDTAGKVGAASMMQQANCLHQLLFPSMAAALHVHPNT